MKKIDRLITPGVELYCIRPNQTLPRKFDPTFTKDVLVHHIAKGSLLSRNTWNPALRRFKEAGE